MARALDGKLQFEFSKRELAGHPVWSAVLEARDGPVTWRIVTVLLLAFAVLRTTLAPRACK